MRKTVKADFFPAYDEDGGLLVALAPAVAGSGGTAPRAPRRAGPRPRPGGARPPRGRLREPCRLLAQRARVARPRARRAPRAASSVVGVELGRGPPVRSPPGGCGHVPARAARRCDDGAPGEDVREDGEVDSAHPFTVRPRREARSPCRKSRIDADVGSPVPRLRAPPRARGRRSCTRAGTSCSRGHATRKPRPRSRSSSPPSSSPRSPRSPGTSSAEAWPYIAASAALELAYFALLAAAYRRSELGLVYPLARGLAPVFVLAVAAARARRGPRRGPGARRRRGRRSACSSCAGCGRDADARGTVLAVAVAGCIAGYTLVDKDGMEPRRALPYLELVLVGPALAYAAGAHRASADGAGGARGGRLPRPSRRASRCSRRTPSSSPPSSGRRPRPSPPCARRASSSRRSSPRSSCTSA